jgi:hypothetical protein
MKQGELGLVGIKNIAGRERVSLTCSLAKASAPSNPRYI